MKTVTLNFKLFLAFLAMLGTLRSHSQTCTANFAYYVQTNGVVNFSSTSVGTNSVSQYFWTFTGGTPSTYTGTGFSGMYASSAFTASGIYTVTLFFMTVPSCSAQTTMTIAVTYTPPPCAINVSMTPATATNMCNGSATVVGTTGLCAPITYTWSTASTGPSIGALCPGNTYTVIASGGGGTNCCASASQTFAITAPANTCNVNASFTYSTGANGLVNFYNTSTGTNSVTTTYTYNFNNGSNSNSPNPSTTYTANGGYWVFFWVANSPTCWDSTSVYVNITNAGGGGPCLLNADFNYSLAPNGVVNFYNTSTGTATNSSYAYYSLGNPTVFINSTTPNFTYTFTANGTYTVKMLVNNPAMIPFCGDSVTKVIVVNNITGPCNLSASFAHTVGAGGQVNFASTSTGTVANTVYYWNYGDGSTGFGANPSHTYPSAGVYFVILTAINNSVSCFNTASMAINVTGMGCVANSNFSIAPTNTAQYWTATPAFPWNISSATWSWGDGSSSNGLYVSHTYSASGNYMICLTVTASCGSTSSTCATYSISRTNNAMIQINVISPELVPVGLNESFANSAELVVYPNPGTGLFNLEVQGTKTDVLNVKVYNLQGVLSANKTLRNENGAAVQLDLRDLAPGVYFLQIDQGLKQPYKKLIITKD